MQLDSQDDQIDSRRDLKTPGGCTVILFTKAIAMARLKLASSGEDVGQKAAPVDCAYQAAEVDGGSEYVKRRTKPGQAIRSLGARMERRWLCPVD